MSAFMIVYARVTDAKRFDGYVQAVQPLIARHGGKLIGRANPPLVLEGVFEWQTVGLLEFPSLDAARNFWSSSDYAKVKALRDGAAEFQVVLVGQPA
jgi:uncharacterized protein (DUF1330 family)